MRIYKLKSVVVSDETQARLLIPIILCILATGLALNSTGTLVPALSGLLMLGSVVSYAWSIRRIDKDVANIVNDALKDNIENVSNDSLLDEMHNRGCLVYAIYANSKLDKLNSMASPHVEPKHVQELVKEWAEAQNEAR